MNGVFRCINIFCHLFVLSISLFTLNLQAEPQGRSLIVSHNLNNPPFKFVNDSNKSDGILIDLWKLWSVKTGIPVQFTATDFENTITMIKQGKADVNAGLFRSPEREKYLDFTEPVLELEYFLFCDKSVRNLIQGVNEIYPFAIGVPEGFTADFAKKKYPDASIRTYPDLPSIYESCGNGSLKVFISPKENLKYYLEINREQNNYVTINDEPVYVQEYRGAVSKGNRDILLKINAGLKAISKDEIAELKRSWLEKIKKEYFFSGSGNPLLNAQEINYIVSAGEIPVSGDPDWPPHSMYDNSGNYIGIIPDMWELIRNKSGLKLKIIRSENWAQTLNLIREGEVIVIDCISRTDERSGYMDFSDVIFTSNLVMIGQDDLDYINGLSDTGDLSVAVQEGTSEIELIKRDYPGLKLIFYSDADIAYRDVSAGKIDLFLRHQADFTFRKKESVLSNLKIAGPTEYKREYRIGVAKGNCTLLSILNKSLSSITPQEKNIIFEKWIGSEKFVINYDLVWKTGIISLLIILTIIYWNRRLAREIELKEMAQAALEAAMEKVELATRAKSEFLANMSHEIRTPMNAIIGFSELLKKTPLTSSQETYLNTIKSGGETLLNIINDILDLSKIEANKMEVNYSYFDLHSLVFELKQFFGEKLSSKNLEFLIENDPCLPRIILLDELRVRQIFFNLLSNALKFTDRGHIKVISSFVQKEGIKIDLKITVEDTGSGIRKEDHEKIFGAFEQAGTTEISKKFQGTGLGLAITKKLTELMNGRISVESEPGAGSKFIVEFFDVATDRNTLAGSDKSVIDGGSIKFRNAKILIADDIESNRLLLTEICRNFGFEILEAENGLQALESAKLNVPDLILMDVRMPEMDGYEAVGKIKSDPKLKQIPVIAVTASVMSSDRAKIEKHNFDGHIRKPVILQELVENLKKYIPYEISGNKREVIDEGDEIILEKDELIHELDTNVGVQISLAKENHNFAQIRELSEQLKTLAVRHNSAVLKNYARMLFESVMRYDVEDIRILLNNYNDIAEHIKRNNGGSNGGQEL